MRKIIFRFLFSEDALKKKFSNSLVKSTLV
jgi:hypothetical protein